MTIDMGKTEFIKIGLDYYNIVHIMKIETCGQPGDRWYRVVLSSGQRLDIDEAVRLRLTGKVPSEQKTSKRANPEEKRKNI